MSIHIKMSLAQKTQTKKSFEKGLTYTFPFNSLPKLSGIIQEGR